MTLSREEFESLVQSAYDSLPEQFQSNMENVQIVVDEAPTAEINARLGIRPPTVLLGLYEGIPLTKRGTSYGMYPVVPDKISLFKHAIERSADTREELRSAIQRVLIHEIAHYYGMNEEEVRAAGF
ncbi:MAG: metallopeptidase family protein [Ignavibacteriae bacterium]|nr:metallopeptidase family protein [Ignavibacteriota bacterium]